MAGTATLLSSTQVDANTLQNKYSLSQPLDGYKVVAVTMYAASNLELNQTVIYGISSDSSRVETWTNLAGSYYGSCDPILALSNAGYTIGGSQSAKT
jgi:hypothetical protein